MYTLSNFYKSREWEKLLLVIKQERAHDDGLLYCEFCGEPIVRMYDCIGHHMIVLDESNVNDATIALNQDNIQLVHHRCHNKIHNKLGHSERQVFLVYGSPLAGKSSWVQEAQEPGDLIVDMDNIWQCVSGLDRYQKPKRLNACVFGIRDTLLDMVRMRVGYWRNAYVIGGYALCSERERLANRLGAREIFIDTSMEECINRLYERQDGRDVKEWERYIREWWRTYPPTTFMR